MRVLRPGSRRSQRLHRSAAALLIGAVLASGAGWAQTGEPIGSRADQFKAAYLFNFVKFVEWPPHVARESDHLTVCFVGGDGVYQALAKDIAHKRVGNKQLAVRRLDAAASLADCNAVYLEATQLADQLAKLRELPVLTVSDAGEFASGDGIIGLFLESNRLRFSINLDNAQKSGLRISSSLLQLAASIQRNH